MIVEWLLAELFVSVIRERVRSTSFFSWNGEFLRVNCAYFLRNKNDV